MNRRTRSKTTATWLALLAGPLGIHRFYLKGPGDWVGWLFPIPTALGLWGVDRMQTLGQDDALAWWLAPLLGFSVTAACLSALVYGLTDPARWNARHNPDRPEALAGRTHWFTVLAVVLALLLGASALMASLALSFQRYFEQQVQQRL